VPKQPVCRKNLKPRKIVTYLCGVLAGTVKKMNLKYGKIEKL